jgi:Protein of unknown function (DUF3179)
VKAIAVAGLLAAAVLAGCGGASGGGATGGGTGGGKARDPTQADVQVSRAGWKTDFAKHSVPLDQFASGGPGKDGIPAIDHPRFVPVEAADRFLTDDEPVAVVELDGVAKAYPIQIMVWHEIVNDTIDGHPIALTYCPLCNSTVAFSRIVRGRTLSFGTTGNLRNSDLVMYDRQTESWWQQLTAEAVVGKLTGANLKVLPSQILSWAEFKRAHPDGLVLSRNTGYDRPYGQNPYAGYDQPNSAPFAFSGKPDPELPPKERVAAVRTGDRAAVVYPFSRLEHEAPVDDDIDGRPVVVFFDRKVASPLDAPEVSLGKDVGAAAIFDRRLRGRTLTFEDGPRPATFRDHQTGSTWSMSGRATDGPLNGEHLKQVPSDDQFWFALAAFFPHPDIRG